jgi:hypothetical protein
VCNALALLQVTWACPIKFCILSSAQHIILPYGSLLPFLHVIINILKRCCQLFSLSLMLFLQCIASHSDTRMPFLRGNVTFLIHLKDSELLSATVLIIFALFTLIVL